MDAEKPNVVHVPWADLIPERFRVSNADGTLDLEATAAKLNESYLSAQNDAVINRVADQTPKRQRMRRIR